MRREISWWPFLIGIYFLSINRSIFFHGSRLKISCFLHLSRVWNEARGGTKGVSKPYFIRNMLAFHSATFNQRETSADVSNAETIAAEMLFYSSTVQFCHWTCWICQKWESSGHFIVEIRVYLKFSRKFQDSAASEDVFLVQVIQRSLESLNQMTELLMTAAYSQVLHSDSGVLRLMLTKTNVSVAN